MTPKLAYYFRSLYGNIIYTSNTFSGSVTRQETTYEGWNFNSGNYLFTTGDYSEGQ